jgi:hypothetical protein
MKLTQDIIDKIENSTELELITMKKQLNEISVAEKEIIKIRDAYAELIKKRAETLGIII